MHVVASWHIMHQPQCHQHHTNACLWHNTNTSMPNPSQSSPAVNSRCLPVCLSAGDRCSKGRQPATTAGSCITSCLSNTDSGRTAAAAASRTISRCSAGRSSSTCSDISRSSSTGCWQQGRWRRQQCSLSTSHQPGVSRAVQQHEHVSTSRSSRSSCARRSGRQRCRCLPLYNLLSARPPTAHRAAKGSG